MKKDRQRRSVRQRGHSNREAPHRDVLVRTTLFLGDNLSRNLDLLAVQEGQSKGELIRRVMAEYLEKRGFEPHRRPARVNVQYEAEG